MSQKYGEDFFFVRFYGGHENRLLNTLNISNFSIEVFRILTLLDKFHVISFNRYYDDIYEVRLKCGTTSGQL